MPKNPRPSKKVQDLAISKVERDFDFYNSLLINYRQKWLNLFLSTYTFDVRDRNQPGQSTIFFPKAFEQVEKIAPRIYGNNPKFVLSLNVARNPEIAEADMVANRDSAQLGLNYFWKLGQCQKKGRNWVKQGLVTGIAWAKAVFERNTLITQSSEESFDEEGNLVIRETTKEQVLNEFPTFEVPDILDMYFDPRIELESDMLSIIEVKDNVRYADLEANKDLYFNLDRVKALVGNPQIEGDQKKQTKFNLQGVVTQQQTDEKLLTVKNWYGYFSEKEDEGSNEWYLITTVNACEVIRYEKIDFNPWVKWNPIEVPSQGVGVGIVEPIEKLQKAYNLTRNQRAENISLILNRMWLMKQGAGIDPRKLISRAGNIIPTRDMDALSPIVTPDVTGSAFNEAQSINTEIQQTLGTIDTTQDAGSNGFTNLATGQKIRWNEYNVRFKAIKQNFEEALARLGEKMLLMVGKEAENDPVVQDPITQKFFALAKTAFNNVSDFYSVTVLPDSTSYDSIENKREEVLALWTLLTAAKAQGVNINAEKAFRNVLESFPGVNPDDLILPPQPQQQAPEQGGPNIPKAAIEGAQVQQAPENQLNQQLTKV